MIRKSLLLAVLVVTSLAACNRERASLTSSYGQGVVTGQVTMAEGLGSPAGLEVSVRGTGMSVTLADDGRFAFAGVPQNAALDFRRGADGVNATMRLMTNEGFVAVEVNKDGTSMKRRGPGGESVTELEGTVLRISATELVLEDRRAGETTVVLNAATVIRKGNAAVLPADVAAGTRVHVRATKAGDVLTALLVIVQKTNDDDDDGDDDTPGFRREHEGIVKAATATSLTLLNSHGEEVTFVLDAATVIRKGKTILTAADLQPDLRVHVRATEGAAGPIATLVIVQGGRGGEDGGDDDGGKDDDPPAVREFEGTVRSASASALVVATKREEVTFVLTAQTEIRRGNERLTAADLKADMRVHVKASVDGETKTAVQVTVQKSK